MSSKLFLRLIRVLSLSLLAALGTSMLMYTAPGYFSDASELDAQHAAATRVDLAKLHERQASLPLLLSTEVKGWVHRDLGTSRQYGIPVADLLQSRWRSSVTLLISGLALGWAMALSAAIAFSLVRAKGLDVAIAVGSAMLLATPVGALATLCVISGFGGPVLVLGMLVAVRDFKLLFRLLCELWSAPYLLHARTQGLSVRQMLLSHVSRSLRRDLLALLALSFTLGLSALVPVEVIFDRAGLGQLAWSAAMNRDLPVLVAITAVMALCIGFAEALAGSSLRKEGDLCV